MTEAVDTEARDRIAKLYTEHRELAADYWGPHKSNGRRSMVTDIDCRLVEIEQTVERLNNTRAQDCLGMAALNKYLDAVNKEDMNMQLEKIKGKTLMKVQWLQLAGIVLVALIALLK